jgi:L-aminopeptidase/D-esterase-like protein
MQVEKAALSEMGAFQIGQAEDAAAATGVSVAIALKGAVTGVDVRGGSPATRDTAPLSPLANRRATHAVMLAGGSSYGLDAAGGVMRFLEEKKAGRDVGVTTVPNVSGAILFDLKCGSGLVRPGPEMGYAACLDAFEGHAPRSGNFGAGCGATVGKHRGIGRAMKGGIGFSFLRYGKLLCGAMAAVNCAGDVIGPDGSIVAGTLTEDRCAFADSEEIVLSEYGAYSDLFGNTVIGVVMTNARLSKAEASKLAGHGQNAIARRIRPSHSVPDGDTVFAMASGEVEATLDAAAILATRAFEAAILDAAASAEGAYGYPSARGIAPSARQGCR